MIWSTITIVIVSILGLLLLTLFLIILSPFYFSADFSWINHKGQGFVSFWWLSPFLVSIKYDLSAKTHSIKIAGRMIRPKKKMEEVPQMSNEVPLQERKIPVSVQHVPEMNKESEKEENVFFEEEKPELKLEEKAPEQKYTGPDATTLEPSLEVKPKEVEKKAEKRDNVFDRFKRSKVLFFLRDRCWRGKITGWVLRVIRSLFRTIRFDNFQLYVKAGLEDPSSVGAIYGVYEAVRYALAEQSRRFEIQFEPVFMEDHLELSGVSGIKSSIGRIMMPVLVAMFSFPYLSTLMLWRGSRKLRKQTRVAQ